MTESRFAPLNEQIAKGRATEATRDAILSRISATGDFNAIGLANNLLAALLEVSLVPYRFVSGTLDGATRQAAILGTATLDEATVLRDEVAELARLQAETAAQVKAMCEKFPVYG